MAGLDLVIFDCDGVLVDTEEASCRAMAEAIAVLGWSPDWREVHRRFAGMMIADIVVAVEAELGRAVPGAWPGLFRERAARAFGAGVDPVEGVPALLDSLALPFCVASNGPHEKMRLTLGSAGLLARFDGRMFSAYDIGRGKPAPDLFLHAADAMGAAPQRCLVLEDSAAGLAAARAAGMHVACFQPHDPPHGADLAGVHVVRAMDQVAALLARL